MRLALLCAALVVTGCGARTALHEADASVDAEAVDALLDASDASEVATDTFTEPDAVVTDVGCVDDSECDDFVSCTRDLCTGGRCAHVPLDDKCDDGLFCTGDEKCDVVKGCFTIPRGCADPIDCTVDACDETKKTCTHAPDDARCPISHVCDPALGCQARAIAHSRTELYEVRLPSGIVKLIGPTSITLTDVALHPSGVLYGVAFEGLCEVDLKTGACTTKLIPLPDNPVGLDAAPDGTLYGAAGTRIYTVNRTTGATKDVASFPAGLTASGDVAFVGSRGLVTARTSTDDVLVEFDSVKATSKSLGRTGYRCIWGLAAYGPTLYGLTCEGRVLRMDPNTGASSELSKVAVEFWGATAR